MSSVNDFLKRACDRNGFRRDRYEERRVPTDPSEITVFPFFGDLRSASILSSFLLRRYREETKGSKYFILCTWPGMGSLFPYVDEYWSLADRSNLARFYREASTMKNSSDLYAIYIRNLNEFFRDVTDCRDLQGVYDHGIQQEFWDRYRHVKRFRAGLSSSSVLPSNFNVSLAERGGFKVFVTPTRWVPSWRNGKVRLLESRKDFWIELIRRMNDEGLAPFVWKSFLTHDLSAELAGSCVTLAEDDIGKTMTAMRAVGCVLDVLGDVSSLAFAARTPFVSVTERSYFANVRQWEFDDLVGPDVPRRYIYSFSTILTDGNPKFWHADIIPNVIRQVKEFVPEVSRDEFPSAVESHDIVPYDSVRRRKSTRLGTRFVKIEKD